MEKKTARLTEEWNPIFDSVLRAIPGAKTARAEALSQFFACLRSLCVAGGFGGVPDRLLDAYEKARFIICDTPFDAVYLSMLRRFPEETLQTKAEDWLDLRQMVKLREERGEARVAYDVRMGELLNAFEDFYANTGEMEKKAALENAYLNRAKDFVEMRRQLSTDCSLKVVRILQTIALGTSDLSHFSAANDLLVRVVTFSDVPSSPQKKSSSAVASRSKQPESIRPDPVAHEAHHCLFVQFHRYYLEYPPARLARVMRAFTEVLFTPHRDIILLTLRFFSGLAYDHNFSLLLPAWSIPAYLSGLAEEEHCFPSQMMISAATRFLRMEAGIALILQALEIIAALCRCHYALHGADVSRLVQTLVQFLDTSVVNREVDAATKVVEILQLIMEQLDLGREPRPGLVMKLTSADIIPIFGSYLIQLEQIGKVFYKEIDVFKKSRVWRKLQAGPARSNFASSSPPPNSGTRDRPVQAARHGPAGETCEIAHGRRGLRLLLLQRRDPVCDQRTSRRHQDLLKGPHLDRAIRWEHPGANNKHVLLRLRQQTDR